MHLYFYIYIYICIYIFIHQYCKITPYSFTPTPPCDSQTTPKSPEGSKASRDLPGPAWDPRGVEGINIDTYIHIYIYICIHMC